MRLDHLLSKEPYGAKQITVNTLEFSFERASIDPQKVKISDEAESEYFAGAPKANSF